MPYQLARELVTVCMEAERTKKRPLLMLVLAEPPPVAIQRQGRKSLRAAIDPYLETTLTKVPAREHTREELSAAVDTAVAWVTWREVRDAARRGASSYASDSSGDRAVRRLVALLETVLEWHDAEPD